MKIRVLLLSLLTVAVAMMSFITKEGHEKHKTLELGADAPLTDRKMMDVSGEDFSLNDLRKENGLCVIFSCNTCPFVVGSSSNVGWEGRYNNIAKDCEQYKVGLVMVNSNAARRDDGDSMEDMKARAKEKGFLSKYVIDNNSELADEFGAKTTPHVFLFDSDLKLVYRGAIDDNHKDPEFVDEAFLFDAIDNLASGEEISPADTKATGCSIKRVKK
ncbi:MAG: thioredoxin family protein [Flavobacteriales bacterium]|nr:thioredoxin family protein [Flavobacteriales bacterium]